MTEQKLELTWYNKDMALIPTEQGRYGYSWVDPTDPRYCQTHYLETVETITGAQADKEDGQTYSERADLTPQDDNLLILGESGDVLEALTRVPELTDKYVGKVKLVYIDPPFNTAQTFTNYEDNLEHSIWLTMMRDRLYHLKKLLADDGSIWVHLDDVENHRMRVLLDEVFGASNFVAEVVWNHTAQSKNDTPHFSNHHNVLLVYARDKNKLGRFYIPRSDYDNRAYSNPDNDPRGLWRSGYVHSPSVRETLRYPLETPSGKIIDPPEKGWRWSPPTMQEKVESGEVIFVNDETWIVRKIYLSNSPGKTPRNLWSVEEVGGTRNANAEIKALFPGMSPFATPKPERLLERIIHIATNPGDIVLDVFAGSGTTAAVAQKMGRRWVTCELVEDTFERFTKARLTKVVMGEDLGGVSVTKGERVDATEDGLPEGLSADDAQMLVSLLNKAVKDEPELKNNAVVKAIKERVKTTKTKDTINWRGGGGFTVARLSQPCFDVDADTGLVVLTEHANAANLARSVAAHLRFRLTPDHPVFPAKRGNMNLWVTRQPLTQEALDELVFYVPEGEAVTIAATSADPELGGYLHKSCPGSRIIHLPDGLFTRTLTTKDED